MASRKKVPEAVPEAAPERETLTLGPSEGGNTVFAAWPGLYHLFGARVERFDIEDNGIVAVNLTFNPKYDAKTIINDIYQRGDKVVNSRLELFPGHFQLLGQEPAPFTTADACTSWMTKTFKGAEGGEGNRSPQYAKDAIAEYKTTKGFAVPRGRPRKVIRISEIGSLNESVLEDVEPQELTKLKETLDRMFDMVESSTETVPV